MPNFANNARGTLNSSISASATAITLGSGQGGLFPSSDFNVTLQQKTSGVVDLQEIVHVTSRSGDVLTVTRAYEACPRTETSTTQEATAYSFSAYVDSNNGTTISLYVTGGVLNTIQTNISSKLNIAGGLRTGLGANKLMVSDGSGNETTISAGTASQYLKGDYTRGTPPLDINGQTTNDTIDKANDTVAYYDASAGATRKTIMNNLFPEASEATKGVVERATDAEASAGTDTTRYITPKQAKDYLYPKASTGYFSGFSTTTIAHGLGRSPYLVRFSLSTSGLARYPVRVGVRTAAKQHCLATTDGGSSEHFAYRDGQVIFLQDSSGDAVYATCSVDATNITLTRTTLSTYGGSYLNAVTIREAFA